ncbi:MAG: glutathione S-transferase family protein [Micropepsaceae bacterium]
MLKLIVLPKAFGMRNASAFCLKGEALLAMSGLRHEIEYSLPNKAPRGKLPVLVDDGLVIPDSSHIQRHLELKHGVDFDGPLTALQKADAQAHRRLAEEHLYWVIAYARFVEHPDITRQSFFPTVPWPLRHVVFHSVRKGIVAEMRGHGVGRHTREEIFAFGVADVEAIAHRLAGKCYFFGDRFTSIDASLYAILANIVLPPVDSQIKAAASAYPALGDYVTRCEATVFGGLAARE